MDPRPITSPVYTSTSGTTSAVRLDTSTPRASARPPTTYLSVAEAAQYLNTSVRFVRRLIAERRIAFHKLGTHVRIATADLDAFLLAGRVEPARPAIRVEVA